MKSEQADGIFFLCADPRNEKANTWKYAKRLLVPEGKLVAPIGLFGTVPALARPLYFSMKVAAIMEDTLFALDNFAQPNFRVIGHDCGIYKMLGRFPRFKGCDFSLQEKMDDTVIAAKNIEEMFPGRPVSAHFLREDKTFEQLFTNGIVWF